MYPSVGHTNICNVPESNPLHAVYMSPYQFLRFACLIDDCYYIFQLEFHYNSLLIIIIYVDEKIH